MPWKLKLVFVALAVATAACQHPHASSPRSRPGSEAAPAAGAAVAASGDIACPPLAEALVSGDLAATRRLLEQGVRLDWEILFKPGAMPTVANLCRARGAAEPEGKFLSPLHLALRTGGVESTRWLLSRGAALEDRDPYGFTPLWIAISQRNSAMVDLLLAGGADPRSKLALSSRDLYEDLRPKALDLDAQRKLLQGASYLHLAAQLGDLVLVERLLAVGVAVDARTEHGRTPLHDAGDAKVVGALVDKGAVVDARDADGLTALALAVAAGDLPIAQALVARGANTGGRRLLGEAANAPERAQGPGAGPLVVVAAEALEALPALHQAAALGDEAAVRKHLAAVEVDARDAKGFTALHHAAGMGHPAAVKALLEKGAAVNAPGPDEQTPLHLAAGGIWLEHLEVAKQLAAAKADLEAFDEIGRAPLHVAAGLGHVEMIAALLTLGADANLSNRFRLDLRPLHLAARHGRTEAVAALLDRGAQPDPVSENGHGKTPLMEAASHGHPDTVQALLARGAQIGATAGRGCSALHEAAFFGDAAMVQLLLSKGAQLEARCEDGSTPLMMAVQSGRREVAAALLERGAAVDSREQAGGTALDLAESFAGQAVIGLLRERGAKHGAELGPPPVKAPRVPAPDPKACPAPVFAVAKKGAPAGLKKALGCDPSAKDAAGTTPLHWAVVADQPETLAALARHASRLDAPDGQNLPPLALAVLLDRREAAERLLASGAPVEAAWKVPDEVHSSAPLTLSAYGREEQFQQLGFQRELTALHLAAALGRVELAKLLLDRGASLAAQTFPSALTPLHLAAEGNHAAIVGLLLDRGAKIDARDSLKQTPLFSAAANGAMEALKLLLARGADVRARGEGFGTALNFALEVRREAALEVVGALLAGGADPNSRGQGDVTPLHQLAFGGDLQTAALLIERGADPGLKDAEGRTPLDLARLAENRPLEELLTKRRP